MESKYLVFEYIRPPPTAPTDGKCPLVRFTEKNWVFREIGRVISFIYLMTYYRPTTQNIIYRPIYEQRSCLYSYLWSDFKHGLNDIHSQ